MNVGPNDHYPAVDERAVVALNNSWDVVTPAIDPCVNGSYAVMAATNGTFRDMKGSAQCVITNPPYKRRRRSDYGHANHCRDRERYCHACCPGTRAVGLRFDAAAYVSAALCRVHQTAV